MTPRFELWVQLETAKISCLGIIDTKLFSGRSGEKGGLSGRTTSPNDGKGINGDPIVAGYDPKGAGQPRERSERSFP